MIFKSIPPALFVSALRHVTSISAAIAGDTLKLPCVGLVAEAAASLFARLAKRLPSTFFSSPRTRQDGPGNLRLSSPVRYELGSMRKVYFDREGRVIDTFESVPRTSTNASRAKKAEFKLIQYLAGSTLESSFLVLDHETKTWRSYPEWNGIIK